jgi:hypothetical protein
MSGDDSSLPTRPPGLIMGPDGELILAEFGPARPRTDRLKHRAAFWRLRGRT